MKRTLLTFGIATLFFTTAFSQEANTATENPNAPVISFESEVVDYGTIDQGAEGTREFKFTNTGKEPLIISNARGSCGCTVPTWPTNPIKPGESASISVKYDTKRVGPINKSITITSNANEPTKVLRIKGNVIAPQTSPEKPAPAGVPVER